MKKLDQPSQISSVPSNHDNLLKFSSFITPNITHYSLQNSPCQYQGEQNASSSLSPDTKLNKSCNYSPTPYECRDGGYDLMTNKVNNQNLGEHIYARMSNQSTEAKFNFIIDDDADNPSLNVDNTLKKKDQATIIDYNIGISNAISNECTSNDNHQQSISQQIVTFNTNENMIQSLPTNNYPCQAGQNYTSQNANPKKKFSSMDDRQDNESFQAQNASLNKHNIGNKSINEKVFFQNQTDTIIKNLPESQNLIRGSIQEYHQINTLINSNSDNSYENIRLKNHSDSNNNDSKSQGIRSLSPVYESQESKMNILASGNKSCITKCSSSENNQTLVSPNDLGGDTFRSPIENSFQAMKSPDLSNFPSRNNLSNGNLPMPKLSSNQQLNIPKLSKPKGRNSGTPNKNDNELNSSNLLIKNNFQSQDMELTESEFIQKIKNNLKGITKCKIHNQPFTLFCTWTKQLNCFECLYSNNSANNSHSRSNSSNGIKRNLLSLRNAFSTINECNKLFKLEAREKITMLDDALKICHQNINLFQSSIEDISVQISREFNIIYEELKLREKQLNEFIMNNLKNEIYNIRRKMQDIEFLKNCFRDAKDVDPQYSLELGVHFFSVFNLLKSSIKNHEDIQNIIPITQDDLMLIDFSNRQNLKEEIQNFGKILPKSPRKKSKKGKSPSWTPSSTRFTGTQNSYQHVQQKSLSSSNNSINQPTILSNRSQLSLNGVRNSSEKESIKNISKTRPSDRPMTQEKENNGAVSEGCIYYEHDFHRNMNQLAYQATPTTRMQTTNSSVQNSHNNFRIPYDQYTKSNNKENRSNMPSEYHYHPLNNPNLDALVANMAYNPVLTGNFDKKSYNVNGDNEIPYNGKDNFGKIINMPKHYNENQSQRLLSPSYGTPSMNRSHGESLTSGLPSNIISGRPSNTSSSVPIIQNITLHSQIDFEITPESSFAFTGVIQDNICSQNAEFVTCTSDSGKNQDQQYEMVPRNDKANAIAMVNANSKVGCNTQATPNFEEYNHCRSVKTDANLINPIIKEDNKNNINEAAIIANEIKGNTVLFHDSLILTEELMRKDLHSILPSDIQSAKLLYRMSRDGASSLMFHEKCDSLSPCIVLIKTNKEYTFGYYMPIAFISEDKYNACQNSFIFTLRNPTLQKPMIFPVKPDKRLIALYQSKGSPCLGSTVQNKQDLWIQFDALETSCSNLGYAYLIPSGIDGSKILAGKYTNWNIQEIEIYMLNS